MRALVNVNVTNELTILTGGFCQWLRHGSLNQVQIREMQELVRMQRLKVEGHEIIRRQQHYHSQRSSRETRMSPPGNNHWPGSDRPVSNYFEYESLHIAGHTVALNGPPYKPQQVQYQGNRRLPTVAVGSAEDGGPFLRRVDRATGGHSNDYGTQGRLPQRESVYGAPSYGNNNRPAPLAGSKV